MMMLPLHSHHSVPRKLSISLVALGMAIAGPGSVSADERFLEPIYTSHVAGIENFVAADRFRVGAHIGGRRLGSVGLNFAEQFLVRAESRVPAASLATTELRFTMGDTSLVRMLICPH